MFTDMRSATRFDETLAGVEFGLPRVGAWNSTVELGMLRLGEGLLGAKVQNGLHEWFRSEPRELSYAARGGLRPYADFKLRRQFPLTESLALAPRFVGVTAPGFRSSLEGAMRLSWAPASAVAFHGSAGFRTDRVDYAPLRPLTFDTGPTFALGATFFDSVALSWTHNEYGLQERHWTLAFRFPYR